MKHTPSDRRTGIKAALLSIVLLQSGVYGLSPALVAISRAFEGATDTSVQFLMTLPAMVITAVSLAAAKLAVRVPQRTLALVGMSLILLSAAGAYCFHGSLAALYGWAAVLGVGIGLCKPIPAAGAAINFTGRERAALMGTFSSVQNIGAMIMSIAGGVLAATAWHKVYYVYLLAVPGIICSYLFLPDGGMRAARSGERFLVSKNLLFCCAIMAIYAMLYNCGPTNLALLIHERGLGGTAVSGAVSSVLLLGGVTGGMLFSRVERRIGRQTITLGFSLLTLGYLAVSLGTSLFALAPGFFLTGSCIGFILPQINLLIISDRPASQITMAMACGLASGNLGGSAAPLMTALAAAVTGSGLVAPRMLLCLVISAACTAASFLVFYRVRADA